MIHFSSIPFLFVRDSHNVCLINQLTKHLLGEPIFMANHEVYKNTNLLELYLIFSWTNYFLWQRIY